MLRQNRGEVLTTADLVEKIKDFFNFYYREEILSDQKARINLAVLKSYLRIYHSKTISNDLLVELLNEHLNGGICESTSENINQNLTLISNNCIELDNNSEQTAINIRVILDQFVRFFKLAWNRFTSPSVKTKFMKFFNQFHLTENQFFIDQKSFKESLSDIARNKFRSLMSVLDLKNNQEIYRQKPLNTKITPNEGATIYQFIPRNKQHIIQTDPGLI